LIDLSAIFKRAGEQLFWRRLADEQIAEGGAGTPIEVDQAYFVVRMKEMYLGRIRLLWRKYYPMLHAFVEAGGSDEQAVCGPGQLQDLGNVNLDRVVVLNDRLAGPTPYRGGDVSLLVGLYSVPGQDAAKALISTVSSFAALGGAAVGQAAQIAGLVKDGVDSILGLGETKLQLGVSDSFYPSGNPLRPGFYVGIAAPIRDVDVKTLWLKEGHLVKGVDPNVGRPYQDHDYMVIAVEPLDKRDDWPGLPGIAELNEDFARIMSDNSTDAQEKGRRLNALWPTFQQALASSKFLTQPDRERIAGSVVEDLSNRLKAMTSGGPFPFETKSWSGEMKPPEEFELADVPDYIDVSDPASRQLGRDALQGLRSF
jgi:hypothetical protein